MKMGLVLTLYPVLIKSNIKVTPMLGFVYLSIFEFLVVHGKILSTGMVGTDLLGQAHLMALSMSVAPVCVVPCLLASSSLTGIKLS